MTGARLGAVLRSVGGLLLAASVVWWVVSYRHFFEDLGVGRCLTCLYSYSDVCKLGGGLVNLLDGTPVYTPTFFWIGAGLFGVGFVLAAASAPKA